MPGIVLDVEAKMTPRCVSSLKGLTSWGGKQSNQKATITLSDKCELGVRQHALRACRRLTYPSPGQSRKASLRKRHDTQS